MYKIAIFFRKTAKPNIFREIILNSLSSDFDEYCICSAFFQEPYKYSSGRASGKFSTSQDMLNSLSLKNNKHIKIYGLYSSNPFSSNKPWEKQFRLFCQNLNSLSLKASNLKCSFYKFKNKSHAKIFFAKEKDKIQLAIIGSSNVSAGAFADRTSKQRWNHECDVIFWNENNIPTNSIVSSILDSLNDEDKNAIFVANYDEEHFINKINVKDKLSSLEHDILNSSFQLTL